MTDYPADPFSNPPPEFDDLFPQHCDTPLDDLLQSPKPFDIINGLCLKIWDSYPNGFSAAEAPVEERVVMLVHGSKGYLDNSGFEQLFVYGMPGDLDFALTVDAYERIGAFEAAAAIRGVLELVPKGLPSPQLGDYYLEHVDHETRRRLDDAFYEACGDFRRGRINQQVVEYILANRKAYEHLDDAQGNA